MKPFRWGRCVALLWLIMTGLGRGESGPVSLDPSAPVLAVVDGRLTRGGQLYVGIGVNYYDAFNRVLADPADESFVSGFAALAACGVPFVRLDISGYWPCHLALFDRDPAEYFARLDRVVEAARQAGVGIIPSFFWTTFAVPDVVGETVDQWGVDGSATRRFMRKWVSAVVARYRASPAIFAWEFGNEWNLAVDLPNAAEHRPPIQPSLGTPSIRSAADELTTPMVRPAWIEFASLVRSLDPIRPISTGHAAMRPSQSHQYGWIAGTVPEEKAWEADSVIQAKQITLLMHPDPFDLISIHAYDRPSDWYGELSKECGKPLFVGEFGVPGAASNPRFAELLGSVRSAPLSAVWVFDRDGDEFNIPPSSGRAGVLGLIAPD
jgi:hypothetical protein